jgi:hypothetical protein
MCWLWPAFGAHSAVQWKTSNLRQEFVSAVLKTRKFETWNLSGDGIGIEMERRGVSSYAEAASAVYWAFARTQNKQTLRWGDKNNFHTAHVGLLLKLFPRAQLIHIVRDPRDVACSYRELATPTSASPYQPALPRECPLIAGEWLRNVEAVEREAAALSPAQYRLVRYEDLVAFPKETLAALCSWMGFTFEEPMLSFHQQNKSEQLEPRATLDWKQLTLEPITERRVGRYRTELTPAERREITDVAGPFMSTLGYTS